VSDYIDDNDGCQPYRYHEPNDDLRFYVGPPEPHATDKPDDEDDKEDDR
jgi:hypothetical protein